MSILDCVRPFNGLIKQCFAWLIEAGARGRNFPLFFSLVAAKVQHVGRINLEAGNVSIIKLICSGGRCVSGSVAALMMISG